jgi:hypothetical protein
MRELQTGEVNRFCIRKIDLVARFASSIVVSPKIIIVKTIVGVWRRVAMAIEVIIMGWARIPIMGRRVIMMRTRIAVVRLAAIILMERWILMMRRILFNRAGILVMRKAIKLVVLTKLIMRVEVVVVHGAIWAMMRRRVKAFGLLFVQGILVLIVGISMPAARVLWVIGTWIRRAIDWRTRGTLPPIRPRRTGRAIIGRRARRRRRRRRGWGRRWGRRWWRRRGWRGRRRTIWSALAMDMSDMDGRLRGRGSADGAIVASLVAVIGLADAQRGVTLDDSVCVGATRDRVDGGGSDEGEVEEGEQEKVTSVDRHRHNEWKSSQHDWGMNSEIESL